MFRFLAHSIVIDGVRHSLSLVSIDSLGNVDIQPFDVETHSTKFVDGTIEITTRPGLMPVVTADGRPLIIPHDTK